MLKIKARIRKQSSISTRQTKANYIEKNMKKYTVTDQPRLHIVFYSSKKGVLDETGLDTLKERYPQLECAVVLDMDYDGKFKPLAPFKEIARGTCDMVIVLIKVSDLGKISK
jgi:hypothetical protein